MPDIEVTIDNQGRQSIVKIDMLIDFWYDYLLFRKKARTASRNQDQSKIHRYLRAGLFSFIHYLTGLLNRWRAETFGPDRTGPDSASPISTLSDRLAELSQRRGGPLPPKDDLDYLTSIASRCADLHPSDESDLFFALSLDKTEAAERKILAWLDEFIQSTGLGRHSASFLAALEYVDEGSLQAYDPYAIDPFPFQDAPWVWEFPEGEGPSGQAHD